MRQTFLLSPVAASEASRFVSKGCDKRFASVVPCESVVEGKAGKDTFADVSVSVAGYLVSKKGHKRFDPESVVEDEADEASIIVVLVAAAVG